MAKSPVDPRTWTKPGKARYESAGLAKWLLTPETFQMIGVPWQRPSLPSGLGCCHVLVVNKQTKETPFLRPAFILPLQWKKDAAGHQPHLPKGLVAVAENVKAHLKQNLGKQAAEDFDAWTLHFSVKNAPNLSELSPDEDSWSSAWISLFAGLWLAIKGLLPNPQVFATGAWQDGLQPITGLDAKAAVAQEFGASRLFYSEGSQPTDFPNTFQSTDGSCVLQSISRTESFKAAECLKYLLSAMAHEPDSTASDTELDAYYQVRFQANKDSAREFYCRVLSPRIAEKNQNSAVRNASLGTLITWVSNGWELIYNDLLLIKPKLLIVLTNRDFDLTNKAISDIDDWCKTLQVPWIHLHFDGNLEPTFLFEELCNRLRELSLPKPWHIDITLGTVTMSLALYRFSEEAVSYYYWNKEMKQHSVIPSTSRLLSVPAR